jgi:hypothetical protein
MSTLRARALLAALWISVASLCAGAVFAQELPTHVLFQRIAPLPAEANNATPESVPLDNWFGADVAIRDGFVFAGMPKTNASGQVAVFTQQGTTGHWIRTATIVASDRTEGDDFGRAVSYRDGLLIVGSNRAAYVYKRVSGTWREQQKITPAAADSIRVFAVDLKHEAGTLAIGSQRTAAIPALPGALYILEQNAAGIFVQRARLIGPAGEPAFGRAVSMTKREIVVGSTESAYIVARNSSGNWVRRQRLVPANPVIDGFDVQGFGAAVAIDNGMILVGAPNTLGNDESSSGIVFGFVPGAGQYVQTFELSSQVRSGQLEFGSALAMFGNRIAISASEFNANPDIEPAVQVLTYSRTGSSVQALGTTGFTEGRFPASVAIANNVLLAGSPLDRACMFFGVGCVGEANLFDLNHFQ